MCVHCYIPAARLFGIFVIKCAVYGVLRLCFCSVVSLCLFVGTFDRGNHIVVLAKFITPSNARTLPSTGMNCLMCFLNCIAGFIMIIELTWNCFWCIVMRILCEPIKMFYSECFFSCDLYVFDLFFIYFVCYCCRESIESL